MADCNNRNSAVLSIPKRSSLSIRRDSGLAPTTRSGVSGTDAATNKSEHRELSTEDEILSIKLRSLYNSGLSNTEAQSVIESLRGTNPTLGQDEKRISTFSKTSDLSMSPSLGVNGESSSKRVSATSPHASNLTVNTSEDTAAEKEERRDHEYAGGLEDWEDVDGGDVDRFGLP